MKQAIFLSFNCEIFSKMPTARIFVGDTLIDEIEIPHFTNNFFDELKLCKTFEIAFLIVKPDLGLFFE